MKNFFKGIMVGLTSLVFIAGIAYATTLNFVQTPTDALYSSLSSPGTTMRIAPYPIDLDGNKLTITDFGSNPTVTVDPKVRTVEEIIGFTGITDNGDNTATLTGLSRDLTSKSPYTTTGTGRQHAAGAIVVFSNNPQMYARFAALENIQTITGLWTFASSPLVPTPTTAFQAATKAYVDSVVAAGCAISQEATMGCTQLATQLQMASSTFNASTPTVLYTKYATSSPYKIGLWIPVTQNDGTLNPNFISTTSASTYNWGGNNSYTGTSLFTGSSTMSSTTISVLSIGVIQSTTTAATTATSTITNLKISNNATTTNLFVSNACSGCTAPTIVSTGLGNLNGGSPSIATASASCSGGKLLSGGGLNSGSAVGSQESSSYPSSATTWTASVSGANGSSAASGATVYAVCINP